MLVQNQVIQKVANENGIVLTNKEVNRIMKLVKTTLPTYKGKTALNEAITDAIFETCNVGQNIDIYEYFD